MTNQTQIRAHVARGFAVVAKQAGEPAQWYRPNGITNPIVPANLLGTVQLYADSNPNLMAAAPLKFASPSLFAAFDSTLGVVPGDYLQDSVWGMTFVASMEPFRPALLARCSGTVTLLRGTQGDAYGNATRDTLASGWPCAIDVAKGRASVSPMRLPNNPRMAGAVIMLPVSFPAQPRPGDTLVDMQTVPMEYLIEGADLSTEGWLLTTSTRAP